MSQHLVPVAGAKRRGRGLQVPGHSVARGPYVVAVEPAETGSYPKPAIEHSSAKQLPVEDHKIVGHESPVHTIARRPDVPAAITVVSPSEDPQLTSEIEEPEMRAPREGRMFGFPLP